MIHWGLSFWLWITPLFAQVDFPLTWLQAAREAMDRSPSVQAALRRSQMAELEEPLVLSNLDPQLETGYSLTNDQAPRDAPAFQGNRSHLEEWRAGISQNTLLGTQARITWFNERLENPTPFRPLDPSTESRLHLELKQPLLRYFWGRPDIARRRRARASSQAARIQWRSAQEQAALSALRAFWELYFAQEQIRIREKGLEDAKRLLSKYVEKRRYGLAEPSDLLQAKASVEIQQTELQIAGTQWEKAWNALSAALGRSERPDHLEITPPTDFLQIPDPEGTEESLIQKRAEVEMARLQRESLEWNLRVEKLDTLPDLSLRAGYSFAGLDTNYSKAWSDLTGWKHSIKTAGATISIPFTFWKERLTRRQARLRLETAKEEERGIQNKALQELRDARESLRLARQQLQARQRLVEIERKKFEAEEENFRRGRSSTDLLVRFQQDIRRSQTELLGAQMEEAMARLSLAKASGTLLGALKP